MKKRMIFSLVLVFFLWPSLLTSQQLQTGTIRGTVTDEDGAPLPGVSVSVKGLSLLGTVTDVSKDNGLFRAPALPPGTYTISFELKGFQPVRRENIIINVGMVVTLNIQMKVSAIQEEITVLAASPVVDVQSTKIATQITRDIIMNLPMQRSLDRIMGMTAGTVSGIMHGGTAISHAYEVDGINVNDPSMNGRFVTVEYDAMEEVEVITGGLPAQVGNTGGSFVNVVTKSGGNKFSGMIQMYYTNEDLNEILFSDEQIKALNVGKPTFNIYQINTSAILGGPIVKDKLWFFGDLGMTRNKFMSTFLPTTILGKSYEQYQPYNRNYNGFLKLTTQLGKNLRVFVMANHSNPYTPYSGAGTYTTAEACQERTDYNWAFTANASWILSPNTFIDFRAGVADIQWNIYFQPGTEQNYAFNDAYTFYSWGSTGRFGEPVWRNSKQASVRLTHFQDGFLGGDHEFRAGVEVQTGVDEWTWYRDNPVFWYYYKGNPYYYRGLYGLTGPHPTYGDGLLYFYICGPKSSPNVVNGSEVRFGSYIQDTWTIKNRLTLNFGVRFDTYNGYLPESTKVASLGISPAIGEALFVPQFGFNPYGAMTIDRWDDVMGWSPLSPRFGFSYDLFGDGKTAVKASFSRYAEAMPVMYFQTVHPLRPVSYGFYWTDLNNNGVPDAPPGDKYVAFGASVQQMLPSYYKQRIDPDIKAPMYNEYAASINHELFRDFNVGLQFIYREKKDTVGAILYDPNTKRYWNTYEKATDWWIPFTTIVPSAGSFPERAVTMYFMSNNAPAQMTAFANVPEAERKYQALELTFNKRMSHGWQLGGSVVWSQTKGNNTDDYGSVWGYSAAYLQANWFVNRFGYIGSDCPLAIKLFGTFSLPLRFLASFYYVHFSGAPWQRSVTVYPPAGWAAANNAQGLSYSVNLESSGTRRDTAYDNLDFRLEKELGLGRFGKLGVFVDVFNLLGNQYVTIGMNPGGTWRPSDANTNVGTYTASSSFGKVTNISGVRNFRLSARFSF